MYSLDAAQAELVKAHDPLDDSEDRLDGGLALRVDPLPFGRAHPVLHPLNRIGIGRRLCHRHPSLPEWTVVVLQESSNAASAGAISPTSFDLWLSWSTDAWALQACSKPLDDGMIRESGSVKLIWSLRRGPGTDSRGAGLNLLLGLGDLRQAFLPAPE